MSDIFSKIIAREIPADIVYEDDVVLAFLDINPIQKGHTLVVPKKEYTNIFDINSDVLAHMIVVSQKIARTLKRTTQAPGINIHMNNGHEAGQDVFHAHIHVIPRFARGEAFTTASHETYAPGESSLLAEKINSGLH